MSKSMKKFFAFFLALMLVFSMSTVMAFAVEDSTPEESPTENAATETQDAPAEDATNTQGTDSTENTEGTSEDSTVTDPAEGETEPATEDTANDATNESANESATEEPAKEEVATETTETEAEAPIATAEAETSTGTSLTILHTNDVHCGNLEGYAKLAGYRDELVQGGKNVLVVDAGDHVQGETIGVITKGEEIIKIMNGVGYDFAVPGNHEYDYQIPQFRKNVGDANYPYISSNFKNADGSKFVVNDSKTIDPYYITTVGDKKVAFVGISTPETYTKSTPVYFQDSDGNWLYTFNEDTEAAPGRFIKTIQDGIDAAKEAGADVVIAVGHTGMKSSKEEWNTETIIKNTTGLSAYIDGHSHEVAEDGTYQGTTFTDKDGKAVTYAQTGTKLANIGEMTINIADDNTVTVDAKLIKVEDLTAENEEVKALVDAAKAKVEAYVGEVIGISEAELTILREDGTRAVRSQETNLGDFNADAFKTVTGAEISLVNGGGVRKNLPEGEITRNDLIAVNPFGNEVIMIKAKGQTILDALEHAARNNPKENGGFFQVSGLTYEIYTHIPTPVIADDQNMFQSVNPDMPRRVANVKINGEDIDPEREYTVGGTSYILQQSGDGMTMFKDCEVLRVDYPNDSNSLLQYMSETLKGTITAAQYGNPTGDGRINIFTKEAHVFDEDKISKIEVTEDNILYYYECIGVESDEEGNYMTNEDGTYVACTEIEVVKEAIPTVTYVDPVTGYNVVVKMIATVDETAMAVVLTAPEAPTAPTREGYVFAGWEGIGTVAPDGSYTMVAKWEEAETEKPAPEVKPQEPTKPETKPEAKPTETAKATTTTKSTSSVPKTGDETNVALYILLFAGAMGTGAAAAYKRKNDNAA